MNKKQLLRYITASCILFPTASGLAAEPIISGITGEIASDNTITVMGSNFGTKVTGTFSEYFDDYSSDWSCNSTSGSGCSKPGGWSGINISGSDVDRGRTYIPGKNLLEIIGSGASNYSTGFGYRRLQGYSNVSYGVYNQHLYKNLSTANQKEFWIRFYVRMGDNKIRWTGDADKRQWVNSKFLWVRVGNSSDNGQLILEGMYSTSYNFNNFALYKFANQGLGGTSSTSIPTYADATYPGTNKWFEIRIRLRNESSAGANNGILEYYFNGKKSISRNNMNFTSEPESLEFYQIGIGGNIQNTNGGLFSPGEYGYMYVDDITLVEGSSDPGSIATVYLSNASTWGNGVSDRWNGDARFIRQAIGGDSEAEYGFKGWSNSQFTFKVNPDGLNVTEPIYIYVTNWSGETNSDGVLLKEGGGPPPQPTLQVPADFTKETE